VSRVPWPPPHAERVVSGFVAAGDAVLHDGKLPGAGSKRAKVLTDKSGKVIWTRDRRGVAIPKVVIWDTTGARGKKWRQIVEANAKSLFGENREKLDCGVAVEYRFIRRRVKSHFGTGRNAAVLKDSAPAFPTTIPDLTKLVRLVEDAITGIVWVDDGRVVRQLNAEDFGPDPGVEFTIWRMPETVADLREVEEQAVLFAVEEAEKEMTPAEQVLRDGPVVHDGDVPGV
jgi:Holliday junction resolvase RusA-like endonuclease